MKERFAKLIDVKSIMTLVLTIVFCVLALTGVISGAEFQTIFTVIVGFYFGTQAQKAAANAYTGPQQGSFGTVVEEAAPIEEAVDDSTQNDVHPPDDIVVKGFVE